MDEAYVSLTTNNDYAEGALVLARSLRNTQTTRKLVLMVTSGVSSATREKLNKVWDEIIDVTLLDSQDKENLVLLARPELGCTFSKLRAWTLTQFKKCVFLDADTLVLQNVDDLFEREELSAAPDIGWPDCFNSGVFVFKPSLAKYTKLLEHAETKGSFDGGDQGLLNEFFDEWSTKDISYHLPFTYNMVFNVTYSYNPAFIRYGRDVKIVHFLGSVKPWHHHFDEKSHKVVMLQSSNAANETFNQMWWELYREDIPVNASETQVPSRSPETLLSTWQQWHSSRIESQKIRDRKGSWEKGTPDYTGEDKFENIKAHFSSMLLKDKPAHATLLPTVAVSLPSVSAELPSSAAELPSASADLPSAPAGSPSAPPGSPSAPAGSPSASAGSPSASAPSTTTTASLTATVDVSAHTSVSPTSSTGGEG